LPYTSICRRVLFARCFTCSKDAIAARQVLGDLLSSETPPQGLPGHIFPRLNYA
jgi:hypothetical protein